LFALRAFVLLDGGVGLLLEVCHHFGQRLETVLACPLCGPEGGGGGRLGGEGCWILSFVQKCLDFGIAEEGMQRAREGAP